MFAVVLCLKIDAILDRECQWKLEKLPGVRKGEGPIAQGMGYCVISSHLIHLINLILPSRGKWQPPAI